MSDSSAPPKIRHEWYQSDNEVVLSVFVKNVKEEDLTVDLAERSLSLNIKLPNGSEIAFDIDPLARSIDVSRSTHRVLSMKLEFKLAKKQAGSRWTALEGDEEPADATPSTSAATSISSTTANHAYPSSSKTKKNWDALAADFEKKEADELAKRKDDKDANAGGDKELNELFKSLYAGATDDQRRAMIKSYQESNGTSLSTSWDEVKKGKVETRPPDSMVAKKWEQ